MPLEMIQDICEDFLQTNFPSKNNSIILSGGEPLLYPAFPQTCEIVRKLNKGRIVLSTNGILVPDYISIFKKNDDIQVSIDGDKITHDYIRGKGSYDKAVAALELLNLYNVRHGIGFTINQTNKKCIDHIIELVTKTGASIFNCNIYQPINKKNLQPIRFKEWLEIREYMASKLEKESMFFSDPCILHACPAGMNGICVLPDGTYLDCIRAGHTIGKYP